MALQLEKPAGTWTYDDLLSLPDDGRRYEIIEGELYEMPAPNLRHATTIMNLIGLLLPIIAALGGRLYTAPVDVFMPGADPVESDLLAVLPGSRAVKLDRGVHGPPDLIIEVLSSAIRGRDLLTKRALYARAGVRECWLVDPGQRTVDILTLAGAAYHTSGHGQAGAAVRSPLLGDAAIPLAAIFSGLDEIAEDPEGQ